MSRTTEALMRRLLPAADREVRATLARLPPPLRERAGRLLIDYEPTPGPAWLESGLDADILGVFDGDTVAVPDMDESPIPPRVTLFLENIWLDADERMDTFRLEVRRTLLHELGHFLGLEEGDLEARGLE